jgi:phosphatidylinositol kinase/protein kinase (PI-3  family)
MIRICSSLIELEQCMVGEQSSGALCQVAADTLNRLGELQRAEEIQNQKRIEVNDLISQTSKTVKIHETTMIEIEHRRLAAANELGRVAVSLINEVQQAMALLVDIAKLLFQLPLPFEDKIDIKSWTVFPGSWHEVQQLSKHAARVLKSEKMQSAEEEPLKKQVDELLELTGSASEIEDALSNLIKAISPQLRSTKTSKQMSLGLVWSDGGVEVEEWKQSNSSDLLARLSKTCDDVEAKAFTLTEQGQAGFKLIQQIINFLDETETCDDAGVWLKSLSALKSVSQLAETSNHLKNQSENNAVQVKEVDDDDDNDDDDDDDDDEELVIGTVVGEQEKNEFAVSVLSRVQERLSGVVNPDQAETLPVPAQVSWLIRQSTDPDSLCQMYEGWAAWI